MFSVLVVEENEFFRKSLAGVLKNSMPAIAIEETGDGDEAIAKIDLRVPDIVLVDLRLRGKNGLELTKEIKRVTLRRRSASSQILTNRNTGPSLLSVVRISFWTRHRYAAIR